MEVTNRRHTSWIWAGVWNRSSRCTTSAAVTSALSAP